MNTQVPCYGFDSERLILSKNQMQQIDFSIEKETPIETCPKYEWMTQDISNQKSKFTTVGYVSLQLLQWQNNVYKEIDTIVPLDSIDGSDSTFGLDARRGINLLVMTRRRYRWDMHCEKHSQEDFVSPIASIE